MVDKGISAGAIDADTKEGFSQIAGPCFNNLGLNIYQECIRGPLAKDHDLGAGDVDQEEAMTAPEGMDSLPIFRGSNPKVGLPPNRVQIVCRVFLVKVWDTKRAVSARQTVLATVEGEKLGIVRQMHVLNDGAPRCVRQGREFCGWCFFLDAGHNLLGLLLTTLCPLSSRSYCMVSLFHCRALL
jgi:hypothetical protein